MKYILSIWLVLCSWMVSLAVEVTAGDFKINTRSNGNAYIISYLGDAESLSIPKTITYNNINYSIVQINQLLATRKNIQTKEVFIPATIQTISTDASLFSFPNNSGIRTVVFENKDFTIGGHKPFDFLTGYKSNPFIDNIIVLGTCNYDKDNLTATNLSSNLFLKTGEITILYNNEQTEQIVQMYLFRDSDTSPWKFTQSRLSDLSSALQKGGKGEGINTIDLTKLSSTGVIPFVIVDKELFEAPIGNLKANISYSRENALYWNSVCLPFPIKESDFPTNTKIYTMTGGDEQSITLTRILEGESLPAGTPCFIYSEVNRWDLSFETTIPVGITPITASNDCWTLIGSFTKEKIGTGKYKLNGDGTAFVSTTSESTVTPFRCYISPKKSGTPARLSVDIDEEADITLVPNDAEPQTVKLYDLMGRPRQGNQPGLFIRSKQ